MRRPLLARFALLSTLGLSAAAVHGACAPDSGLAPLPPPDGGGDTDGSLFDAGSGDALPDPDAACAAVTEEAISVPLNLYVMMDRSQSMTGNKWASAEAGLAAFVNDPKFSGARIALRFFPNEGPPECDQYAYMEPTVPYGPLPGNAGAIVQAIEAEDPNGTSTPIYAALGGALLKGIEVAQNNPGEASAVLLVTDGFPQGPQGTCSGVDPNDAAAIAGLAAAGADFDPPVVTYVVGLPGVDQDFANQVAAAGGSGEAVLVSATNVAAEFQAALAKVTGEALPCEYEVPSQVEGGDVAITSVNVLLTVGGGEPALLPQDPACNGAGWRYDDPANPDTIVLCPGTCTSVREADAAKIQILLGCTTVVE